MTFLPDLHERAATSFNRRDWPTVWALTAELLAQGPGTADLHYMRGISALETQRLSDAAVHLGRAWELAHDRAEYGAQLARVLSMLRMSAQALAVAREALPRARDAATFDTLGVVLSQVHVHDLAAEAFGRAAALMPDSARIRFNLATAWIALGNLDEAEQELEACLGLDPRHWVAHLSLAHLARQSPDSNHLARLHAVMPAANGDAKAQMYVHLAMAKEHEDLGDQARSFEHLQLGKQAGRLGRNYSIERDVALFRALTLAFPTPVQQTVGHRSSEPVFVIGMPRTGTTLVDRILASHPDVYSAGELENFGVVLKRLAGTDSPHLLDPITIGHALRCDPRRLGRAYVESTRPQTGSKARFVDKLPHNFLYAGFIARALPEARIICLRRHPLDTCLSNFRQLFALSSPYYDYSFDLQDTAAYYVLFDRLMTHWKNVLPGRILEIRYEDLVDRQEEMSRQIIEHCGLSWDPACLDFHSTSSPVATASAIQVRTPMYRSAVHRWKRFAKELEPARRYLEAEGVGIE